MIVSVICCKKNRSNKDSIETQSSTGACSDVERPFIIRNNNFNKPLPPTPLTLAQWSNAIHPGLKYADSGFNENILNNSKEHMSNQYEVPYAHLLKPYRPPEEIYFTQEAFMQPQNSNYRPPTQNYSRAASINAKRYYQEYESQWSPKFQGEFYIENSYRFFFQEKILVRSWCLLSCHMYCK